MEPMYRIEARIAYVKDGWRGSDGVPTFYIGPDQGCRSAEHALRIAVRICDPLGANEVHATAYCEATNDYATTSTH